MSPATCEIDHAEKSKLCVISDRIKQRQNAHVLETGRDLLEAKALLKHGEFQAWLKDNFGWSVSLATKLMDVAKDPKAVNFTNLPKSVQYALAAPSTPDIAKSEVIDLIKAGKKPSLALVKKTITAAKKDYAASNEKTTHSSQSNSAHDRLVVRLQAAGLDATLDAVNAAFPEYELSLNKVGEMAG